MVNFLCTPLNNAINNATTQMVFLFIEVKVRQAFVKNAVSLVSLAQERTSQIFLSIFSSLYSEFETYH